MNINIDIYLRGAFRELNSFSIPRIGTFKKVNRNAWADESSSIMFPPSTEIEFDPKIDPDLLLNQYFTDNIQMERSAADQIVGQIQRVILNELDSKGKFEIPEIGILLRNASSMISFQSLDSNKDSVSSDFFGLKPVHISPPPILPPETDSSEIMKSGSMANGSSKSNNLTAIGWKSTLLIALLVALGVLIVNQSPFIKHRSSLTQGLKVRLNEPAPFAEKYGLDEFKENSESQPLDKESSTADLSHSRLDPDPAPESSVTNNKENTVPPVTNIIEPEIKSDGGANQELLAEGNKKEGIIPESSHLRTRSLGTTRGQNEDGGANNYRLERTISNYHLVLGSFQDPKLAKQFAEQLKSEGYNPVILFPPSGSSLTHKVSIFRSTERKDVETYAAKLKKMGKKSGWIFEERKTE